LHDYRSAKGIVMLTIEFDARGLVSLGDVLGRLGERAPMVLRRALNHTGDRAATQVVRALTKQTGLKHRVIVRAVHRERARDAALVYRLLARGGDVRLKYFAARETRKGVSAAPLGRRQVFAGTFLRGGVFPDRVALSLGGQVFQRAGKTRLPISVLRSGVYIPQQMVEGATAEAFTTTVAANLPGRVAHEVSRILTNVG
jgi:hypothetical protein